MQRRGRPRIVRAPKANAAVRRIRQHTRVEPTPEQMERGVAALVPYVQEWKLSLNPEELYELAGAVLTHFDSADSFDAIEAAERARIEEFTRQQAEL